MAELYNKPDIFNFSQQKLRILGNSVLAIGYNLHDPIRLVVVLLVPSISFSFEFETTWGSVQQCQLIGEQQTVKPSIEFLCLKFES